MVGAAGQEDAERGLEAGGARPREAPQITLRPSPSAALPLFVFFSISSKLAGTVICRRNQRCGHTLLDILSLLCRMSFKIVTDNLIKMLTRTFNAIIALSGEI